MDKGYLVGNRYEIIRTLGEGGMANVYLANDIKTNQKVAVKALRYDLQDDESVKRRFEREAKATGTLSHPNIVNVLDVCNDNGKQYIIIEYVHGPNLKKYIRDNFPIPYHEVVDIMEQITAAVAVAHAHGIIHRDLKPENILVDDSKDPIQVKVSDFGIALALSDRSITRTNSLLGSVHYMSPEQIRGGSATELSDIYALGIILFELLAKTVPFQGDTAVAVALKHSKEDIPDLQKIDSHIPQPLENVVLKATAKDPGQRYQSVNEMHKDLETVLLPERAGEKKFVPDPMAGRNLDETRVMPPLHESKQTEESKPEKKKDHKRRNIIIAAVAAVLVLILIIFFAVRGNQETTVPDLSNLTLKQAKVMLRGSNLQVGNISKENDDDVEAGHVIRSIPNKGLKLKNNADVNLVVSLGATYYKMPNLVGKQYEDVSDNLDKRGFKVKLKYIANNNYTSGTILKQSIQSGEQVVAKKKTLTLTLAKPQTAKKKVTRVRDLTGYNLKSIQDYAKEINVTLDVSYAYSDSIADGILISQNPEANSVISSGGTLSVTMSKGPESSKGNSSNNNDNDSNSSSSNSTKNITRNITIPYTNDGSGTPNKVTIYLGDANHNISNPYRTMNISQDTPVLLSFNVKDGQTGNYTVESNNSTILSGSVSG
ncbi:Stk1 family PASTA domain-containing Ser/Thr kinase [Companilactobacillus sp.]|jgi:serine/threonine-protein kinase|uniref:Stk1 family PASTA domain-containing Ser/Thr kinase n=1 Tax=Companilactobacillus sp. TaxID=2767905 RepID=UPI0025B9C6D1|nr:Stk1 family PASTA domain-containing Ser/Thr kinase [Companilactobacillus sp.]MCH4008039.1 Stk1 family PASTA domain-containing Ser/Thr kinase [Companilactobacillus sp.]MCH4051782.1 Stk1 family PASTA domain-containing Ser/Thr kinase [Companilactobacillus sp.]MCH4075982.1 Stk1 family PASTA domain-containing Ser/Thr kinase [Companilactobacillus sp.]MCH4124557.1 Stk1 family PASTA domain-containing Ser/Thr kinase [Companilactobacillus sp.]MCH4132480.1 Stk1 family PASTA domain-containing Ser/Thr k